MTPYIYILNASILATIASCLYTKQTKWLGCGLLLWLVLFIAFRGEYIGIDTPEYYSYFKKPQLGYYGYDTHDMGYNIWQQLFKRVIDNAYIYIPTTTLIGLVPICLLVVKQSKNIAMSVFLFLTLGSATLYLFLYLAAVRQTFAIGLFWLALLFYYKRSWKLCALFYALAALSHSSILLYLPAMFINKLYIKKYWVYIVITTSLVLGLILNKYSSYFYTITSFLNYGTYYVDLLSQSTARLGGAMLFLTLMGIIVTFYNSLDSYWDRLFIAGVIYNNIFAFMGDSTRFSMPLALFGIISITNTIMNRKMIAKYIILAIVIMYGCSKYYKVLQQDGKASNMVPYKSLIIN